MSQAFVRPDINLGAAGGQLINTVAAGTTGAATAANLPNVLAANASDADSPNPLLIPSTANVMVNWYAQQAIDDLTGGKDPQCNDDESHAFLQGIVEWAAELVTTSYGLSGINSESAANNEVISARNESSPRTTRI
ncbi:hypothetical protein [Dactylosporangium sp. NPDC051484]|uniref:hypothetical protein n=1 Tax=Dactylosporangium sp. NPDC051484 TaxID=3154942 RepID=UPI00344E3F5C